MTFEEMQEIIRGMLSVQRELQESQLKFQESQSSIKEDIASLIEQSKQQEKILNRLIGYSLTAESDKLDLEEKMVALERRNKKSG